MFKDAINFFDKLEDGIRGYLSRYPIIYTLIGGVAIVLFWRGVWNTADMIEGQGGILGWAFYAPTNLILVVIVLLATGLFVSYFIGDTILMSGLKGEKKVADRTAKEVREEELKIVELRSTIKDMKKEVDDIEHFVERIEHERHHDGSTAGKQA